MTEELEQRQVELADGDLRKKESPTILVPKKNIIIDATMFTGFEACPRYGDLRFNRHFVSNRGPSNSLECGLTVHKVMEIFYQNMINGLPRNTAIAQGMAAGQLYIDGCAYCANIDMIKDESGIWIPSNLKPECGHQPREYPGLRNTPEENGDKKIGWKWVLKTCEQYFEFYKNDFWVPLFVEKVIGKILYEDDEIRIFWKAKIDLAVDTNQGIFPCDHKTMKQRRETDKLSNQFMGQALLMGVRNVVVNKIGFQTTLEPKEKFTRAIIPYSADALLEFQSEILPYWAYKILQYSESGYYPPNFTSCNSMYGPCVFKQVCEANQNMREDELRMNYVIAPWDVMNIEDD